MFDKNLKNILKKLKEKHQATSLKAEFEAEGLSLKDCKKIKNLCNKTDFDLTIKIGGCEAIKDLYEAKSLKPQNIIAPMIESAFALQKFVMAFKSVFSEEERKNIKFYINIESITGYKNLNEIVNSDFFNDISGIVLGRTDLTASMGLAKNEVNSDRIFNIAENISQIMQKMNRNFIVGGNLSIESIEFFNKLSYITSFETRKIVFDSKILKDNPKNAITEAIEFEISWLKIKKNKTNQEQKRLRKLQVKQTLANANNLIFDLDGTVINSSEEVLQCFEKAFEQAGYQIDKSRLTHNVIGPPLKEIIQDIGNGLNDEKIIDKVMKNFCQIYDYETNDISEFYDGIYDFLNQQKRWGKRIFMATYKPTLPTKRIVKQFKLDMFEDIYTIDKFGKHITKCKMIEDIIKKYNLKKSETVMIGDAASDVISAKEAGIIGIGALWGYGEDKTSLIANSDVVVKNVQELKQLIKG